MPPRREAVAQELRGERRRRRRDARPASSCNATTATTACVRSLGLEPRPPFPKGHVLEDGDWSLLDPGQGQVWYVAAGDLATWVVKHWQSSLAPRVGHLRLTEQATICVSLKDFCHAGFHFRYRR